MNLSSNEKTSFDLDLATDLGNHAAKQVFDSIARVADLSDNPLIRLSIISAVLAQTAQLTARAAGKMNMPEKTFQRVTTALCDGMDRAYKEEKTKAERK